MVVHKDNGSRAQVKGCPPDFARMDQELEALRQAGTVAVHLDVMDGHFVPNLSYGAPVVADWRRRTDFPFDTHLMISEPERYLDDFVRAGCDVIIFHIEVVPEPVALLRRIRAAGIRCQTTRRGSYITRQPAASARLTSSFSSPR